MHASVSASKWRMPDEVWAFVEPWLPKHKNTHCYGGGRPRRSDRDAMDAILFVARTGCQWNALNATGICSSSTAHRRFQEWRAAGVFRKLWSSGLEVFDELRGLDWKWQSLDGAMTKAPLGGEKNRPQPYGSGQARHQAKSAGRGKRSASGSGHRRGQHQ